MSDEADFGQLAEDLSPDDLLIVLGVFASDVKRLTADLNAAAAAQDVATFRRVAHGLAGAAGAVGAKALEQACRSSMMRGGLKPAGLPLVADAINGLADTALAELARFMAERGGAERQAG
jgi:hypothetical protein